MNARQKAFCEYYAASGNATESALKAGYSKSYAMNRIYELLKKVDICGYITELTNKTASKRIMTAIERKEWLSELILKEDERIRINDKIKAIDILNRMEGQYIDKVEVKNDVNDNPLTKLTTKELKELIKNVK